MATITQLKNGKFRVQLRRKEMGYKEAYFATESEAQRWAREVEADALKKHHAASPDVARELTFGALIDKYLESPVYAGKAPSTQARERSAAVRIREEFGKLAVPVVDSLMVQDFFDKRTREKRRLSNGKEAEKRVSGNTVRLEKAFLTALYKFARKRRLAPRNVMKEEDFDLPKCVEKEGRITLEQQIELFRAANLAVQSTKTNPSLLPWLNFVFETGSRPGEAAKVELEWLNFDEKTVSIPKIGQKKRNARVVLIRDELLELLKGQAARAKAAGSPYLFWSFASAKREKSADGKPIRRRRTVEERAARTPTPFAYYHSWRRICTKAKVPPTINPHIIRHEFISRLFESTNLSDSQIAALVGDVNVLSLAPYKHLRVNKLREQHVAHLQAISTEIGGLRERQVSAMNAAFAADETDAEQAAQEKFSLLIAELKLTTTAAASAEPLARLGAYADLRRKGS